LKGFQLIDETASQFGNRNVTINAVKVASQGGANGILYAGRPCTITMILQTHRKVDCPIVGYIVKDRLGRSILGENNNGLDIRLPAMKSDASYRITFSIGIWPNIQAGEYALSIAVADGSEDEHVQCHWLHDAVIFTNVPHRPPVGIFTVTDTRIDLDCL